MSLQVLRVVAREDVHEHAHPPAIERQLERFRLETRPAVTALAARHVRLAELSLSFPALLLALARPRAQFDPKPVIAAVIAGAPLAALAEAARVPLWLRTMQPKLLPGMLPQLPDSPFLRRRIVNHFPSHPKHSERWFGSVSQGARFAHDEFALWCARNFQRHGGRGRLYGVSRLMCLWAWYSLRPGTLAHGLIEKHWRPDIGREAADDATWEWRGMLDVVLNLSRPIADTWLNAGHVQGYDFVPVRDAADLVAEARAMRNCVRNYADDLARGYSRIWSLRKDGVRIATLEMTHRGNDPVPQIAQVQLAENEEPPAEVWLAVHAWLRAQPDARFSGPPAAWDTATLDRTVWIRLWKPYWMEKGRIPSWLPLAPSHDVWRSL
jgi:hypothetical protein